MQMMFKKKYMQEFKDQVVALSDLGKSPAEMAQNIKISKDLV